MRWLAVSVVAACAVLAAGSAAANGLGGHWLLVRVPGLHVYGPPLRPNTPCITALPLPPHALPAVKRAVELAMPPFEARLKLNGRDPRVRVVAAPQSGFYSRAGGCGRVTWARSVVASVSLPHV